MLFDAAKTHCPLIFSGFWAILRRRAFGAIRRQSIPLRRLQPHRMHKPSRHLALLCLYSSLGHGADLRSPDHHEARRNSRAFGLLYGSCRTRSFHLHSIYLWPHFKSLGEEVVSGIVYHLVARCNLAPDDLGRAFPGGSALTSSRQPPEEA